MLLCLYLYWVLRPKEELTTAFITNKYWYHSLLCIQNLDKNIVSPLWKLFHTVQFNISFNWLLRNNFLVLLYNKGVREISQQFSQCYIPCWKPLQALSH